MVFLGASSVSAATATCQESLDLSSSQEAMRGEGFGETETLLGAGAWAPCVCAPPPLAPSCGPWVPASAGSAPPLRLAPRPHQEASLDHAPWIPLLLFLLHISFVWVLLPPPSEGGS